METNWWEAHKENLFQHNLKIEEFNFQDQERSVEVLLRVFPELKL